MKAAELRNRSAEFEVNGKKYTAELDLNGLAYLEEKYGDLDNAFEAIDEAIDKLASDEDKKTKAENKSKSCGSLKHIRAFLTAVMMHTDENIKETEVGKLINLNNLGKISSFVTVACSSSFEKSGEEKN